MVMILLVLVLLPQITALGVAPSREVVEYSTVQKTITVSVINTNHKDMRIAIYPQGDLSEYVTIDTPTIFIKAEEAEKEFTYTIALPANMDPGRHELDIVVLELPQTFIDSDSNTIVTEEQAIVFKDKEKGSLIGATTAIIHQLFINVPYPGKFAEGQLYVSSGNLEEPVTFTMSVFNRGEEDITAIGRVRILGPTNEEIASLQSESKKIGPKEEASLIVQWTSAENPGLYHVEAIVNYDDKQFTLKRNFNVGKHQISIKDIDVQDFRLGDIAKLDIEVENEWNQKMENVYAMIRVLDEAGSLVTQFSTSSISINPQSTDVIHGYWETQGLSIGTYTLNVVLHYGTQQVEKFFETVVSLDEVNIKSFSKIGGQVVTKESGSGMSMLIIIVVVLVLINIGWFVYLRRKKPATPQ